MIALLPVKSLGINPLNSYIEFHTVESSLFPKSLIFFGKEDPPVVIWISVITFLSKPLT